MVLKSVTGLRICFELNSRTPVVVAGYQSGCRELQVSILDLMEI